LAAPELRQRLREVRAAIEAAAQRVGRDAADVRIVAVTKTLSSEVATAALAAGLVDLGENYVQEARAKRQALGGAGTWHLIGGLQRNKIRAAVATFDWIHSLDSVRVATALAAEAERAGRRVPVLIQVNVTGAVGQHGATPEAADGVARAVLTLPSLLLRGLMTIAPPAGDAAARPYFRELHELRDQLAARLGVELPHLSMGMSNDFAVAVEEGATLLRLGRALFGARGFGAMEGP
jgi:pyridoxal phosphate enzyme (YggS family)